MNTAKELPTDVFSPATREDAIELIRSTSSLFSTVGQRKLLSEPALERAFARGDRRPEMVWAVRTGRDVTGLIGARYLSPHRGLIDMVSLPGVNAEAEALVGAATTWALSAGEVEASFNTPPSDAPLDEPASLAAAAAFRTHGWRLLSTRKHYEIAPHDGLGKDVPVVRLEAVGPEGRARVEAFVRLMLPGSLDARDQANLDSRGLDRAAAVATDDLLDDDPIECFRFAVVDEHDAGLVVRQVMPNGNGYVAQVGVAYPFRGRGLAARLVATATRELIADGATTLIANTDDANQPMAQAFAAAGWQQTESRIDLVLA